MAIYRIPELELDRKLEVELDRKPKLELDNCSHPIPELELELDRPFIKELELELDNYSRSFTIIRKLGIRVRNGVNKNLFSI